MSPDVQSLHSMRERLAFRMAPWLRVRYDWQYDEALGTLAEVAYGSKDAIWTSPRVLVDVALREKHTSGEASRG